MNLQLNGEEKKYLQQAISRYLDDLGHEIVRTDNAEFATSFSMKRRC